MGNRYAAPVIIMTENQICSRIDLELGNRFKRTDLKPDAYYVQVKCDNGVKTPIYVGKFIRSYRMGSGDGMTLHVEFYNDIKKKQVVIEEDMWGSILGEELSYFVDAEHCKNKSV